MANKRWQKHTSKGCATGHVGPRQDQVKPDKTCNWPKVPGNTNPKRRNYGMKEMKDGLAPDGI